MLVLLSIVLGGGAHAAPQHGAIFQDWVVRCDQSAEESNQSTCYIAQNLVLKEGNQRVLLFAVANPAGKGPLAVLTLPLGIALPPGVTIQVDGGQVHRFEFERCLQTGCKAGFPLDDALVESFQRGLVAEVVVRDAARRPVTIPVSLKGFTAALRALEQ